VSSNAANLEHLTKKTAMGGPCVEAEGGKDTQENFEMIITKENTS
jgi:hypothetical protein